MKNYKLNVLILVLGLLALNLVLFFNYLKLSEDFNKTQSPVFVKPDAASYAKWITTMPESNFRDNMLVVFAAEFKKESEEVNNILQPYINSSQ